MTAAAPLSVILVGLLGAVVFLVAVVRIALAERRVVTGGTVLRLELAPADPLADTDPGVAA